MKTVVKLQSAKIPVLVFPRGRMDHKAARNFIRHLQVEFGNNGAGEHLWGVPCFATQSGENKAWEAWARRVTHLATLDKLQHPPCHINVENVHLTCLSETIGLKGISSRI